MSRDRAAARFYIRLCMDSIAAQPKFATDTGFDSARVTAAVNALAERHAGQEDVFRTRVAQFLKTELMAARAAAQALLTDAAGPVYNRRNVASLTDQLHRISAELDPGLPLQSLVRSNT